MKATTKHHHSGSVIRISLALCVLTMSALLTSCSNATSGTVIKESAKATPAANAKLEQLTDFNVQMLDAGTKKLSEIQSGNKVLVFDFWATWCGPCRIEVPYLVELQKEYKDKGVEVIGLSVEDPKTDTEKVRAFAKEFNINYTLGFASDQMFNTFTAGSSSIPQTMIFDRNGKLIKHIKGMPRNPELLRSMLRESVDKALQQS